MRIDVSLVAKSSPTLVTPWTVACQAPRSMEFPRQEYWSGLLFPSPGDPPNPGIEPSIKKDQCGLHLVKSLHKGYGNFSSEG